jgi:hypothetical protein
MDDGHFSYITKIEKEKEKEEKALRRTLH